MEEPKNLTMKKHTIVFASLLTSFVSFSQEVVSTQGDSYVSGNGSVDFTIGEVVIDTGTDGTNDITQGFHQSSWNIVGLDDFDASFDVIVYPNPTESILQIKTASYDGVTYELVDYNGRLVLNENLSSELTTIQVEHLLPGNYTLSLSKEQKTVKTFKLTKTN